MPVSYNGLWKLLIDKELKRTDLKSVADISTATIAKLGKNEHVALSVLEKLCAALDCNFGDIIDYVPDEAEE